MKRYESHRHSDVTSDCCWPPDMVSEVSEPWWCNQIVPYFQLPWTREIASLTLDCSSFIISYAHPHKLDSFPDCLYSSISYIFKHIMLSLFLSYKITSFAEWKYIFFYFAGVFLNGDVFWIVDFYSFILLHIISFLPFPQTSASYCNSHLQNQMWHVKYCNWIVWGEILRTVIILHLGPQNKHSTFLLPHHIRN